jgi:hypothetical protein
MTWYPLYRKLNGPQGRSTRVRKISPPPGFDPRTVQSVASRYTDWAIPTFNGYTWQTWKEFLPKTLIFIVDSRQEKKHVAGRTDRQTDAEKTTFVLRINFVILKNECACTNISCRVLGKFLPRMDKDLSTGVWTQRVMSNENNSCWTYCVWLFHYGPEGFELCAERNVFFSLFTVCSVCYQVEAL